MELTNPERSAPQPTGAEEALSVSVDPLERAEAEMTYESERDFVRRARRGRGLGIGAGASPSRL